MYKETSCDVDFMSTQALQDNHNTGNQDEKSYLIAELISPETLKLSKEISEDPVRAKRFLVDAGIIKEDGTLTENYQ